MFSQIRPDLLLVTAAALLAGACAAPPVPSADEMTRSYEQALATTQADAVVLAGGGAPDRQALAAMEAFFGDMRADSVRQQAEQVYAPDAYLNDNITVVRGSAAIGEYFAHTMGRVRTLQVSFLDVSRSGPDYFVRWRMSVESDQLNDGRPMISYGMTHFRFDSQGRVLVHKDFWDAGTGLYEYLPGLRSLLPRVRGMVEEAE